MLVVNLFGTPGSGKSTGAAFLFSALKMYDVNAELITEFAKDKVWEESKQPFLNQAYLFGEQYFRLSRCDGKVDVAVVDSPLPLSLLYHDNPALYDDHFRHFVLNVFNSFDNMNWVLHRVKPYNPVGRIHTEEESNALVTTLLTMLEENGIQYNNENGDLEGYDRIFRSIMEKLGKKVA